MKQAGMGGQIEANGREGRGRNGSGIVVGSETFDTEGRGLWGLSR